LTPYCLEEAWKGATGCRSPHLLPSMYRQVQESASTTLNVQVGVGVANFNPPPYISLCLKT
jgi:hypothetical protein